MILIRNRLAGWLLFGQFSALCLWPFVFVRPEIAESELPKMLHHERIHARQQTEMLWIFFFLIYGLEYLMCLARHHDRNKAYLSIAFEREAYDHEQDQDYLKKRSAYAWVKYWLRYP